MSWKKITVASCVGLGLVAGFEGFVPTAYSPLEGDKLTIGFGHTGDVKKGDAVTLTEAFHLLQEDVSWAEAAVTKRVAVQLKQCQFDALVSLVYNIGEAQFAKSTLLKCVNAGDDECIDTQWMRWKYFKGKVVPGLEKRRALELAHYRGRDVQRVDDKDLCVAGAGCISYNDLAVERPSGSISED